MSTAKMPIVTEKTEFAYNSLGLVARTWSDQSETYSCYYPAQAAADDAARSNTAPDLSTLLRTFKLSDESALADALNLSCPAVPDVRQPPLLGLLQRVRAPDGSTLSANLTLFGYHLATQNDKGVLTPNTVLSLEHISVNTDTNPWTISKATGADGLRITLQQNTRAPDNTGSTQTVTNWYKDNSTRITHIINEQFNHDPATLTHFSRTTTTLNENDQVLTPVLAQQVRSALSGLVLRETRQDELGRPITEIQRSYDARERDTGSFVNAYNEATFTTRENKRTQGHSIQRLETGNGTWVIVRGPDGRCGRTLYDGLQRPVRYELQRIPNDNHSTQNYCLIQEVRYDASGQVIEQTLYDYLPGGLRRRQRNAQMSENMKDWFWQGEKSSCTTDAVGNTTQVTERTVSSLKHGTQLNVRQTLTSHADGRFSERQQKWTGQETVEKNNAIETHKKLDTYGRVVELTETLPNADGSKPETPTRVWRMDYDNLNRKSKQHCPGGMTIEYDYQGYATSPVKLTVRQGDEVRVLASRTLKGDGLQGEQVMTMTRGQGPDAAALTYAYQDRGTTLPDNSKVVSEISADGECVEYFVERPASKGTPAQKTLLVSFKRAPIALAIVKERHDAGDSQCYNSQLITSANLLGTHSSRLHTRNSSHSHAFQRSLLGEVEQVCYASNVHGQVWRDANGLVRRARRGSVEYLYDYTALGELRQLKVLGSSAEYDLEMNCSYDAYGHEASREYRIAGKPVVRHERSWSAAGQLLSKSVYRNGASTPSSTQTYTYDRLRGWLLSWSIDAMEGDHAQDSNGNVITAQSYRYDLIDNLTQCRTVRADGTTETLDYAYHTHYSTRRESVTTTVHDEAGTQTSQETVQLSYDTNGNLSANEQGQILTYTSTGRLASVSDSTGLLTTYEYDADDRLIGQWNNVTKQRMMLAYNGDQLCMETCLDDKDTIVKRRILDDQTALIVQVFESTANVADTRTLFNLTDPHDGGGDQYQFASDGLWKRTGITFSPWGEASLSQLKGIEGLGFNGQRVDPVTGCYHLGNGYRTYDPREKRFQQPDAWSPFGSGGLNDRAYCAGDPVNWHDPSGHFMISRQGAASQLASLDEMIRDTAPPVHERAAWWEWVLMGVFFVVGVVAAIMTGGAMMVFLLAILVISTALEIASLATRHTNPRLSAKLGYAALAVGLVDLAVAGVRKLGQALAGMLRRAKQLRQSIKLHGVTALFRKSRKYAYQVADNADDMSDIGSSASKTRALGGSKVLHPLSKVDSALGGGRHSAQIEDLVEDSLGITTWGGRQKNITALRPNMDNAGGVYAMVDHSHVGKTIFENTLEIKVIDKKISKLQDLAKTIGSANENKSLFNSMHEDVNLLKKTHKAVVQHHKNLSYLKKQHESAFAEVVKLKDIHEKITSMHTLGWSDSLFRPASKTRRMRIETNQDWVYTAASSRPQSNMSIYDELIEAAETASLRGEPLDASFGLEPYRPKDLHTGAPLDSEVLSNQYEKFVLSHEEQTLFHRHKQQMLAALTKKAGFEKGIAELKVLTNSKASPIERAEIFEDVLNIVSNKCAAQHGEAFKRLKDINQAVASQEIILHASISQQFHTYKNLIESSSKFISHSRSQAYTLKNLVDLNSCQITITALSQPKRRLNVFGHLEHKEIIGIASPANYRLKVSTGATQTIATIFEQVERTLDDGKIISEVISKTVPKKLKETVQYWNAEKLNAELVKTGFDPRQYDDVRLVMCHGADGGTSSFAQKFSRAANSQVKAYTGEVTTTGFVKKLEDSYANNLSSHSARGEGRVAAIFDTAAEEASSVYVMVAKHNESSILSNHAYQPQIFSPFQELAG